MSGTTESSLCASLDIRGENADALDKVPREGLVDEELRLLAVLDLTIPEVRRSDGCPVDLVQLSQAAPKLRVLGAGIGQRECPLATVRLRPRNRPVQVRLPPSITAFRGLRIARW